MAPALVDAHRRDLDQLLRLALTDLGLVWQQVDGADAAREALMDLLPQLAQLYGSAAATLGADWYDEMRDAAEAPGRFRALPADLPDRGRTDALARWGIDPLFQAEPDFSAAARRVAGGFQRLVADADRDTVIGSLAADRLGQGWSRQTTGKSCDFCQLIAGRGAVYSAKTADFSSHDDCDCLAVPQFGAGHDVQPYVPSQRRRSDRVRAADNARVREYLRTH